MSTEIESRDNQELKEIESRINLLKVNIVKEYLYSKREEIAKAAQGYWLELPPLKIVSFDHLESGPDYLWLSADGKWGCDAGEFTDQRLEKALEQYALLTDSFFQNTDIETWLKIKKVERLPYPNYSQKVDEIWDSYAQTKNDYVQRNKLNLMLGLENAMETTLLKISYGKNLIV